MRNTKVCRAWAVYRMTLPKNVTGGNGVCEQWEAATQALKASRLNAVDDQVERWAHSCTVRALRPFGAPLEAPGSYPDTSGAAPVPPSPATTTGWRPSRGQGR